MEAALHCLALRVGVIEHPDPQRFRRPYLRTGCSARRTSDGEISVLGAPESVLARCREVDPSIWDQLDDLTARGRRVMGVARRTWVDGEPTDESESELDFLALLGLEDPPRDDVGEALQACRDAGIRVAMLTGDHPRTAEAIAREVGLLGAGGVVLVGESLPESDEELAELLDRPDGAVVARVTPADKFRIARVLRGTRARGRDDRRRGERRTRSPRGGRGGRDGRQRK